MARSGVASAASTPVPVHLTCAGVCLHGSFVSKSDLVVVLEVLLGSHAHLPGQVKLDERHRAKDVLRPFAIWILEV